MSFSGSAKAISTPIPIPIPIPYDQGLPLTVSNSRARYATHQRQTKSFETFRSNFAPELSESVKKPGQSSDVEKTVHILCGGPTETG
jgi:hypothetical protein